MKSRWPNAATAKNGSTECASEHRTKYSVKKTEDRMVMLKMQGRERLGLIRYIPEKKI